MRRRQFLTASVTAATTSLLGACNSSASSHSSTPATPTASSANSTVLLTDGFESGNFSNWARKTIDGNGAIDLVTSPVQQGKHAVRFRVPDDGKSYRSELAMKQLPYGTYSYAFSIYVPSTWDDSGPGTIVAQWHGSKLSNGDDTNPPVSLSIQSGQLTLFVNTLNPDNSVTKGAHPLGAVTKGRWMRVELRVQWSTSSAAGRIALLLDGRTAYTATGTNNYHQKQPPYFKIGIYRPEWNPKKQHPYATGGKPVIVYHDAVTVARIAKVS